MADTAIEWTEKVWNPTTGCDRVSPGCDHCYAMTMAKRLKGMGAAKYQTDGDPRTSGPGFGVATHKDALLLPLSWKKPRKVFVNSMSDLFHDNVPDEFIACVFGVMALAGQHTFQILTKRHARMRSLLSDPGRLARLNPEMLGHWVNDNLWPLRNVWIGVSVENQQWADIRIPALLETPAAVRWLSCEPLLGPIQLHPEWTEIELMGFGGGRAALFPRIDWVVCGGESGRGARPMDPSWTRALRNQCGLAGIPFLFKQWGEYSPRCTLALCGHPCSCNGTNASHPIEMRRVGKHAAGRELDGRTWDEYPERAA